MSVLRALIRDERGAAAEFALVLPLAMLMLFGIIDGGRYMWEIGRLEKATQAGARVAAVTAMIPQGVAGYSYVLDGGLPQGQPVTASAFQGVECEGTAAGGVTCAWKAGDADYDLEPSDAAFDQIYDRMEQFLPGLEPEQVKVDYLPAGSDSNLGFAGDPNGSDVVPLIVVSLQDREFTPIVGFFTGPWGLPSAAYSLLQEDGSGTCFEEQDNDGAACALD